MFETKAVSYNPFILYASDANPAVVSTAGQYFSKSVAGVVEAFYEDSSGNVTQLTSGGALNGADILVPLVDTSTVAYHNVLTLGNRQSLTWEANDVTGLRNGTNAQTFSVYNTYTAGTPDYERLEYFWSSNVAIIRTAASGTGTARNINIRYGGSATTAVFIGTGVSGGLVLASFATSTTLSSGAVTIGGAAQLTSLSGTNIGLFYNFNHNDGGTNSTTDVRCAQFSPTVNYTGATRTGKVVLAHFNPTLISLPTGANAGITFSSVFTNSSFPSIRWFNTSDEDIVVGNTESAEVGWLASNIFGFRTRNTGTGTARAMALFYSGGTTQAINIPASSASAVLFANFSASTAQTRVAIGGAGSICTGGTMVSLAMNESFSPTATSTMAGWALAVTPIINYSNGTPGAGYVYGIHIAPVNTALPTGQSAALHFSSTASALGGAVWDNQTDEQTNYEKVYAKFTSNVFEIGTVKGGSGTLRGIRIGAGTGGLLSFYTATPIAIQTGVAVTAGGIHAALVNLGLITA